MGLLKTVLSLLLTLVFLMAGGNKLSDMIHKETHQTMVNDAKTVWGPVWIPFLCLAAVAWNGRAKPW
jgi:hypothetical protein